MIDICTAILCSMIACLVSIGETSLRWLPIPVRYVWTVVGDLCSLVVLAVLWWFDLEKGDPEHVQGVPVLFIHGFLGSSNNGIYLKHSLDKYRSVFTVNLGDPRLSIEEYARKVRRKVEQICAHSGSKKIVLVGHSMGGLVAQEYCYSYAEQDGVQIEQIIALGTPFRGTSAAHLATFFSRAAKDMLPGSASLSTLQEKASGDCMTRYVCVATETDVMIRPPSSAREGGRRCVIEDLYATGHISLLFSKQVAQRLLAALR